MARPTPKNDGFSRTATSTRARSTRLAGSVREREIALSAAKSSSPIANSITCRHAAMTQTSISNQSREATSHAGKNESCPYDRFHGIAVLAVHITFTQMLAVRAVRITVAKARSNTLLPILGRQVEAALARFPGLAPHLQIVLIRKGPRNAMTAEVELAPETPETRGGGREAGLRRAASSQIDDQV